MRLLIPLLLLLMIGACRTPKQKVANSFSRFPTESRDECIQRYPVKESTIIQTKYLPGKRDTTPGEPVYVLVDTCFEEGDKLPCPPNTHTVDTFLIDSLKVITDTREIERIAEELQMVKISVNVCEAEKELLYDRFKKSSWALLISVLVNLVLGYIVLRRFL